jgi:glycosyltransferase involved in cell wall biosynthesis
VTATVHVVTPTYRPAGGVVKLFDYLIHALELGYGAQVHCPIELGEQEPLLAIPRFGGLLTDERVDFRRGVNVGVGRDDWVIFSWPPHYEAIARGLDRTTPHERVIHLIQNTRHGNPAFASGYALRLLGRPMARIMVAHQVMDACRPHLNPSSLTRTIVEAHDWPYFHRRRTGALPGRLSVGYTTWKSDIGLRVQRVTGPRHAFRSIRRPATWAELRELMHWSDVFLCCPGPQEGFYLPGLEAMAAGALVLTPDVGGNRAYCGFGENCVQVGYEDPEQYAAALDELQAWDPERVQAMRDAGERTLERHRLERERAAFDHFLTELSERCALAAARAA